jgi:hypothetical protein
MVGGKVRGKRGVLPETQNQRGQANAALKTLTGISRIQMR